MKNLELLFENKLETASVVTTASTENNLGVENLLNEDKSFIMKTTSAQDFSITYTYSKVTNINAFCLAQYNFVGTTTLRVRIWPTDDTGLSPAYDSGVSSVILRKIWGIDFVWGVDNIHGQDAEEADDIFLLTFEGVSCKVMQVDIVDSSNPELTTEIGRAFAGLGFIPNYNADYGLQFEDVYDSVQTRTQDGLWADEGNTYREIAFTLSFLSDAEHIELRNEIKKAGRFKDILLIVYPDEYEVKKNMYSIIGKIKENPSFNHDFFNSYVSSYTILEN